MEGTMEKRRRPAASSREKRGNKKRLAPGDRRRFCQLAASIVLFVLAFVGRGVFPQQLAWWQELLCRDVDLQDAFSDFGYALAHGEPVSHSLEELWVDVFADGSVLRVEKNLSGEEAKAAAERVIAQLEQPTHCVGSWYREQQAALVSGAEASQPSVLTSGSAVLKETNIILLDRTEPPKEPEIVTAQAQACTPTGEALPASVSLQYYELGLGETATPVTGTLTSDYGYRDHPVDGDYSFHRGVDIGANTGTPIRSFADGTVEAVGENEVSGRYLRICHENGVQTYYAHCSEVYVTQGEQVEAGQTVAAAGETGNATGPHLHFALQKDGIYLDPSFYVEVT